MSTVNDKMWRHLQHARWRMSPCDLRDAIDMAIFEKFGTGEVPGVDALEYEIAASHVGEVQHELCSQPDIPFGTQMLESLGKALDILNR